MSFNGIVHYKGDNCLLAIKLKIQPMNRCKESFSTPMDSNRQICAGGGSHDRGNTSNVKNNNRILFKVNTNLCSLIIYYQFRCMLW